MKGKQSELARDDTPYDDLVRVRLASHLRAEDFSTSSFVMGPLLLMRHPPLSSFLSSRFSGSPPSKKSPSSDFLIEIFRHGHEEDSFLAHSLDRQEMILDGVQATHVTNVWTSVDGERKENGPSYRRSTLRLPHNLCHTRLAVLWSSRRMRRG